MASAIGTIGLVALAIGTLNWLSPESRETRLMPPRLSIVVLPFTNLSDGHEQQYFADGIAEDLTTDLSRVGQMFVISRNTAFTYRDKPVDTRQIGRELACAMCWKGAFSDWAASSASAPS
jgi:TolB-like protein